MFKPFFLYVGVRYTSAKRRNHFISFISGVSIVCLALGVAALISVLSVMNGFERELKTRILGMAPHAVINGYQPFQDWQSVAEQSLQHPDVLAAAPYVQLQGMLSARGQVKPAFISGVDPKEERKVSIVHDFMDIGKMSDLVPGKFNIVLGVNLAAGLGVNRGDKVTLVLPEAALTPAGVVPRFKRFTVIGLFEVQADMDSNFAMINIEDAGRLIRKPGHIHGVRLKLNDLFKAPEVSKTLATTLPGLYYASDWTKTHGVFFQAVQMEKTMMTFLLFLIVVVAAFNIIASLVMVVSDKQSDIAILRTLGASPRQIMKVFMVQGALVGILGTLAGTALGTTIALNISDFMEWLEGALGRDLLTVYFINYMPSELLMSDVLFVNAVAFMLSFLATLYPSWKASRVEPAEALRHE